ncbi:MAG: hypothetical protein C0393_03775 [Anaerolinea sp.]|nr:hypothetical protein [Anaerolinea sp.]
MTKKQKKDKKPRPPKINQQIPISRIRPLKLTGPRYFLQHAREYPILGCWVNAEWKKSGITPVVIARQQSPDKVIFAVCLVDLYCLGVKDAYANADYSRKKFEQNLPHICSDAPEECSIELAHEIIYGGLEYAKQYGFDPHPDFKRQMADQVLDPPDAYPGTHKVRFGKNGKPFFAAGPYDDERKISQVLSTLTRTAGEGNYNYLFGIGPSDTSDDSME